MVHLGRAVEKDDAYLTLLDDIENVASAVMPTALSLHVGMVAQAWQWNYDVSADDGAPFSEAVFLILRMLRATIPSFIDTPMNLVITWSVDVHVPTNRDDQSLRDGNVVAISQVSWSLWIGVLRRRMFSGILCFRTRYRSLMLLTLGLQASHIESSCHQAFDIQSAPAAIPSIRCIRVLCFAIFDRNAS